MAIDILNEALRKSVIQEILGDENRQRKEDSKIRFEVFKDRQERFVREKMAAEFGKESLKQIRFITSINVAKRIINEQASIYEKEAERTFQTQDGVEATETEQKQIDNIYHFSKANVRLKKANKYFKLHHQDCIQVFPRDGIIDMRILQPHHYDVIVDPSNPEVGKVYILNVMDDDQLPMHKDADNVNQKIGDRDDPEKLSKMRFVWWSDQWNFTTDGNGKLVSMTMLEDGTQVVAPNPNPIGRIPFIDVHDDKDFEFWVRKGQAAVGFNLEFASMLSDTATTSKLQNYSQMVITGDNIPENIETGPQRVIVLPTDSETTNPPTVQFVSPTPDIPGSLELLNIVLNMYLSAEGLDPKLISGKADGQSFSSGVERFLAEISKFSATQDDFDVFKDVESQLFDLFRDWSNILQNTDALIPDLQNGQINDNLDVMVEFHKPEMLESRQEKLDSIIKRLDKKLISRKEAIMEDRNLDTEEQAEEFLEKIDAESAARATMFLGGMTQQQDSEDESENGEERRDKESDVRDQS